MSEDERGRLPKQAGISIKDRLSCLSGKGKMEKEVLAPWLARLSLPPSASLKRRSRLSFVFVGQLCLMRFGDRCQLRI